MGEQNQPTTLAILGTSMVVERVLVRLLEGEGYSVRLLKTSTAGVVDEQQLGDVDLVVLSPSLTSDARDAILDVLRTIPHRRSGAKAPIPVVALCAPTKEEPPLVEEGVKGMPWPISSERLVEEIEASLAGPLPPGYRLDRSDSDVLVLLSASGSVVSRFSSRGVIQKAVVREAWEDYERRRRPA
jgi:CheY-like chemotaxis protein